jgi:hypothetical protein
MPLDILHKVQTALGSDLKRFLRQAGDAKMEIFWREGKEMAWQKGESVGGSLF